MVVTERAQQGMGLHQIVVVAKEGAANGRPKFQILSKFAQNSIFGAVWVSKLFLGAGNLH